MNSTETNTSENPGKASVDINMDTSMSFDQSEGSTPSQVPEDQRGSLTCPCCEAELAVSMETKSGSQHEVVISLSKKENETQPSFSCPASTHPQQKRVNPMDHVVPEDQRGSLTCPCCEAELAVSMETKSGSQHEFVISLSKKENETQPSFSCPASTHPQQKRVNPMDHVAPDVQGASVMETNCGSRTAHSYKMRQDSLDEYPDSLSMKREKKHEGKHPASARPEVGTGREKSNRKPQESEQSSSSSSFWPSTVKVGRVVTAEACGADSAIMQTIMGKKWSWPRVEETHPDNCDVIIVFCPIVSRAGSDVDRAMKDPAVAPGKKPVILVLMHHTRDPDYSTEGMPWTEVYNNVKVVLHVFFHETQRGLLTCKHNQQMITTLQQEVNKYKR